MSLLSENWFHLNISTHNTIGKSKDNYDNTYRIKWGEKYQGERLVDTQIHRDRD